jgi:hypothetical protein
MMAGMNFDLLAISIFTFESEKLHPATTRSGRPKNRTPQTPRQVRKRQDVLPSVSVSHFMRFLDVVEDYVRSPTWVQDSQA